MGWGICGIRTSFPYPAGSVKGSFAGAEILNPDIYLLDEPSANLDLESIRQLKNG